MAMKLGYGFGWVIEADSDGKPTRVQHSGGWVGFRTFIDRDLESKRTLILLTNDSSSYFGQVLSSLRNIVSGKNVRTPKVLIATKLAEIIEAEGASAVAEKYRELRKTERRKIDFGERGITALADLYRERGELENAVAIYQLSIERNEKSANAQRGLGLCMIELGKRHLSKSLEIAPGNEEAITLLKSLGEKVAEAPDLSEEQLDEYVGEYNFTPEIAISVTRAKKVMSCQVTGQSAIEMRMVAKDRFTIDIVDAQIAFQRNEDGKVTALTLRPRWPRTNCGSSVGWKTPRMNTSTEAQAEWILRQG